MSDPACMTLDELAFWHEAAASVHKLSSNTNTEDPCFDCTLAFSAEMRAIDRCNGVPGVARPVPPIRSITERRRENNRRAAQLWRARHPGRKRLPVAEPRTGTLG